MKNIIDFFITRSLIVNVMVALILIVGTMTLFGLQKEIFPKVEFDVVLISTIYPGSTSEDVEKLVSIPLERSLKSVTGIKTLNAVSTEGRSILYMELDPDEDLTTVVDDIKNAIDTVNDLPDEAEVPLVTTMNNQLRGVISVGVFSQEASYQNLRIAARKLRDELETISEVAIVDLLGYRQEEIRIEVDPYKLNRYELTMGDVYQAIKSRSLNLSAGQFETPENNIFIRTVSEFEGVEDVQKVILRSNSSGRSVRIDEVAEVTRKPVKAETLSRSNGKPAIFLDIKIKSSADIVDSVKKIKEKTDQFMAIQSKNSSISTQIKTEYVNDLSYYVSKRLDVLKSNGLWGMLFVLITLMLFLNTRTSIITSAGAPIAFMASFIFMDAFGISLNLISMFALILVLGMLVDDSIIVAEFYYQKLEEGLPPLDAARFAAIKTVKPVTATILTTMVAFGSLFFMGGIMGKFLWPVPAVVIIALMASLFECFVILPNHLYDFVKIKDAHAEKTKWYQPLYNLYEKTIRKALAWPLTIFFIFITTFIFSLYLGFTMFKQGKFELFPGDDVRIVFIQARGHVGVALEQTDRAIKAMEKVTMETLNKNEMENLLSKVGSLTGEHGEKIGSQYGSMILYLTAPVDRERSTDQIINDLTRKIVPLVPDYEITVRKVQGGPPKGNPVDIQISGDNLDELYAFALKVDEELKKQQGVLATEVDFEIGKKQIEIKVNEAEAKRLGLTTYQIALELRRALASDSITQIRESQEDIEVRAILDEKSLSNPESLKLLHVVNNQGRVIPITKVVEFKESEGPFIIRRLDRKRVISVSAGSLDKEITSPVKIVATLKPIITNMIPAQSSISVEFGGENKDTQESLYNLAKSAVIALGMIFFILVVMFNSLAQPIVVMMAIPFGLTGVIMTFFVLDQSLGFMALMGLVALVGVVVNDSIVLVTFINDLLETEKNVVTAVYKGALSRFRAVILTSLTTVAGLLPIAHATNGDPFLKPMALSFAYGLLFATFVTLVFIPINYLLYKKTYNLFKKDKLDTNYKLT